MPCVSQALVASEVGDGRSTLATESRPWKSLPPLAAWHSLHHFLSEGEARVGYCTAGAKAPTPNPQSCLTWLVHWTSSVCDRVKPVVLPVCPAD